VERPKVLLPLVNAPLIEYTLEWLALNKVEEVRGRGRRQGGARRGGAGRAALRSWGRGWAPEEVPENQHDTAREGSGDAKVA
jgi:hypothetical protein